MADKKDDVKDRDYDEITYHPGEGDPAKVKWNGIEFKANVPVRVSRKTTVQVLEKQERTLESGEVVSRSVERRRPLVDLARTNHTFGVNGEPPIAKENAMLHGPRSPEQYQAWASRWIGEATSSAQLDVRWAAEQRMREECGVDDRDIARIMPFFEAQRGILNGTIAMVG